MAVTRISGETMPPQFSSDAGATWKTPVCISDWSLNGTTSSTETETFCGKFTDLGIPSATGSVNAIASTTPAAGEMSLEDVFGFWINKTNLTFRVQYPGTGTPGTDFYASGPANITGVTVTATSPGSVQYSFEFAIQGVVDNTP